MTPRFTGTALATLTSSVMLVSPAWGQTEPDGLPPLPEPTDPSTLSFTLDGAAGLEYRLGDDEFDLARTRSSLTAKREMSPDLDLAVSLAYQWDLYDFDSDNRVGRGGDTWESVHSVDLAARFQYQMTNDWTVFGGPLVQAAFEDGASVSDGLTWGGFGGATYRLDSGLTLGGGVGVTTKLKEDLRVFPIIIVEWELSDQMRVSSRSASGGGRTGVELIFEGKGDWEFAFGAGYDYSRFRLDDGGPAPGGIVENQATPIWFRLTYEPSATCTVSARIGVVAGGELTLDDRLGDEIREVDYDPQALIGVSGRIRF